MCEANPTAPLLTPAQGGEGLATQYLQSSGINQDLLALFRVTAVTAVHDKAQPRCTRRQAQSCALPTIYIARRLGKGLVEALRQSVFPNLMTARTGVSVANRQRASCETEEKRICRWESHNHTRHDHDRQRQTDPEAGDLVPVVIACASARAEARHSAGAQ